MLNAGAKIPEFDTATWSSSLNEVMRLCLTKDPWDRPTAEEIAEYSKLVMNADKRTWSQWKGNDKPKLVSKPKMPLFTIIEMLIGGLSTLLISCSILASLFHKDDDPAVESFGHETPQSLNNEESLNVNHVTNLSLPGTANCYIVSNSGRYKFKTVKGNSTESVGAVVASEVLWESFGTDETPTVGDLVYNVSYDDGYIEFEATGRKGNAVIAAQDADGKILWSWHIWLTDMPEEQVYYNDAGTMMDRNLGATSATPGDVRALGLLYQWGRKDPFLGSSSIKRNREAKSTILWPLPKESTSNTSTIEYRITHPTIFIIEKEDYDDWSYINWGTDNTLWQSSKTIYDPCPVGWRVPDGGDNGIWSKATSLKKFSCKCIRKSMYLSGIFGSSKSICYPISGKRSNYDGGIGNVGGYGYLWSATVSECSSSSISYLSLNSDGYGSSSYFNPLAGCSVRCVKENKQVIL